MICPRRRELESCALGELPEARAREVREHARGCEGCAEEMELLAEEKQLFARRAALPAPPPPAFAEVMDRLRAEGRAGRRTAVRARFWAALAAAAAIAFALIRGGRPTPDEGPAAPKIAPEPPPAAVEAAAARAEEDFGAYLTGTPSNGPDDSPTCAETCEDDGSHPGEVLESRPREGSDP
jgi:anti-sigma factor RsiW